MEPSRGWIGIVLWVALQLSSTFGSYVILLPSAWKYEDQTQICIVVDDSSSPAGEVTVSASGKKYLDRKERTEDGERYRTEFFLSPTTVEIPQGKVEFCQDMAVELREYYLSLTNVAIVGTIGGDTVNFTENLQMSRYNHETIIQTDKYLYQPGQLVQFRIMTVFGPFMNISTEKYSEVAVMTPSKTRIAQWKDVDNSEGLVHLEMRLTDEPEEGSYEIVAQRSADKSSKTAYFKVEEYVLPRYEVTLEPPKYVLSRDESFSFKVCATYTFGQPVKGDLSVTINNNGYRKCRTAITRNETFSGCQEIQVLSSDMRMVDCNIHSVYVSATVSEEGTGVEISKNTHISISRNPVSFKTIFNDRYMKYNLPYAMKVKAERPDGTPADGIPVEMCYDRSCTNITTPLDGIIKINVMNFDSRRVVMRNLITLADLHDSVFTADIERYFSPSNSSLLIYAPEGDIKCLSGEDTQYNLQLLFSTPDLSSAVINVQVKARGRIQYWATSDYEFRESKLPMEDDGSSVRPIPSPGPGTVGVIDIPLKLPTTVSPNAWVLVWYIRADGEVVSDSRKLTMEKCLPNRVDLYWSTTKAEPGQQNTVTIKSEAGSLCSLGIVDRSTDLLTPAGNAITKDTFFSLLGSYSYDWRHRSRVNDYQYCRDKHSSGGRSHGYNYYTDYVDSLKMFDDTGLIVFSDLQLETRPCEKQEYLVNRAPEVVYSMNRGGGGLMAMGPPGPPSAVAMEDHDYSLSMESSHVTVTEILESDVAPRTDFPETWLWDLIHIPAFGESVESVTMPDTITEWVGNAVCVHPQKGVGVSEKTSVTTFTPFFLDLTLPPSVKRGEILPVKISIFNYMEEQLPVTVVLGASDEYEILGKAMESLCVKPNDMEVHAIKIRPSVIGDVNITVAAHVDHRYAHMCGSGATRVQKRDALIKPIVVEADGFPREKTWNKYVCSTDLSDGENVLESWEVSAPSAIVEGSDRGWVAAVGDLLALSLENLGHLIRMPYGCGEQNMLNFAPNIFILQYLDATRQSAPEARQKLLKYMNTGYQRQLLYLRDDGSFSAFGNADDEGSTFLTAFVLRSFAQAKKYILVDRNNIKNMKRWLKRTQQLDGCYESVGTMFNKAMKGGLGEYESSVPLTAYVIISLLESGGNLTSSSMTSAIDCLTHYSSRDPYFLALKSYAFALFGETTTQVVLDELVGLASKDKTSMHWEFGRYSRRSRSLEVEIAGYAVLAMLKWDAKKYENEIRRTIKWLSSMRNGRGGFISTQDTVVALQAMSSFGSYVNVGDLNAVITVKTPDLTHSFNVEESNKLLHQQVTLPSLPTTVHLSMEGEGCVMMQAVLRYNIPDPEPSDAFGLSASARTVRDKNCVTKELEVCASYLLPDGASNMAVIEINLVSGYIPDKDDLKKLVRDSSNAIKRYEVDGYKVSLYVQELTNNQLCASSRVIRDIDIENAKPGSVVVYDYYQPEFSLSKSYKLPPNDECIYSY